jgi:alpha-1,6-mannosyltransferase
VTIKSRLQSPSQALILICLASAAIYLAFVLLYPLTVHGYADRPFDLEQLSRARPWSAAVYVVGLVTLFALFWAALKLTPRSTIQPHTVVAFGLLFGLILIWLYPVTATDLFQYVLRARVRVVHGANPMIVAPDSFPDDPLLPFAGEWAGILSPYGPVWELLAEGVAWLGFSDAVGGAMAYKVVALLAYLACTGLLAWGTGGDARALIFFAWNPLVLLEGLGNGHNDVLMLAWTLLAVLLWEKRRLWSLAVVTLSLAVLTKASAALLAPLLMVAVLREQRGWLQRAGVLLGAGSLALVLVLVAYLPFWPPWESLRGVLDELDNRYTYTIAALMRMILREFISVELALAIPRTIGRVVFVSFYLWTMLQVWRRRATVAQAGLVSFLAYLLTSTSYRIWYPLWLVPLAALDLTRSNRLRTFVLCLTSELSILMFYLVWRWILNGVVLPQASWLTMHLLTVPWQFGLPLLLPLWRLPQKEQPAAP